MKRAITVLALTLAACGGGGSDEPATPERELYHFERCKIRLVDNKCPISEIVHKVPNIGVIIK